MKRFLALILGVTIISVAFTGGGQENSNTDEKSTEQSQQDNPNNKNELEVDGKVYKIGVAQFAEHGSLENCRKGFVEGLAKEGFIVGENIEIDYQNAQADMGITNQIAGSMVGSGTDIICAIATPMAQAVYNAAEGKDIPLIYTAVTDPVAANLSSQDGLSNGNATGTSDKLPVEEQLKTIRSFLPEAKNIGILYSTSEVNSESAIAEYKQLADKYGFVIIESGISAPADIPLAMDSLLTKVDCMTNLTDNTVVNSLAVVLDKANAKNIPVFGSEIEQVKNGCVAAAGLEYVQLGEQTAKMAARVLKGESAGEIPFETIEESSLYINSAALDKLGLTSPKELADIAIEVE